MTREWILEPFENAPERRRRPAWQRYALSVVAVLALGVFCGILGVLVVLILAKYAGS